jgi:glutamate racemase
MKNTEELLGIFDSGVGGFSVLKELRKVTDANILYFGDCARAPYGNHSPAKIVLYIKEILTELQSSGVTHFVSACNSMSVVTTEKILYECGIAKENYIDMVDAVKLLSFPAESKVLIVGTKATIESGVYQDILTSKGVEVAIYIPATLAGEIEKNMTRDIMKSIDGVIEYAFSSKATHVVYACTHYPLVDVLFKEQAHKKQWQGIFVDPSVQMAVTISRWNISGSRKIEFKTSKETDMFTSYSQMMW